MKAVIRLRDEALEKLAKKEAEMAAAAAAKQADVVRELRIISQS